MAEGMAVGSAAQPALRLVSNAELNDRARREAESRQDQPLISGLSAYLDRAWQEAAQAKEPIQRQLLKDLRQRAGIYEPDQLALIRKTGGSEIFLLLTALKCRAALSLIRDVLAQPGDKAWGLDTTPIEDLPPHIQQNIYAQIYQEAMVAARQAGAVVPPEVIEAEIEQMREVVRLQMKEIARRAADRMERKIEDQLAEGGWDKAFDQFLNDFVTFSAAFIKGPVLRRRKRLKWAKIGGRWKPVVTEELVPEYERVSPFDVYPSADATSTEDGYYFIRQKLRISTLQAMKGAPGYDAEAISQAILEYGKGGLRNWLQYDTERAIAEGRPYEYLLPSQTIEALEFVGQAPGFMLLEWGMTREQVPDPTANYDICALKIGRWVVKAVLNPHPLGKRNLHKACFEAIPGSYWGNSLPFVIRDIQEMCNGAARSLANNLGMASGPQTILNDIGRIPVGTGITQPFPWKVWQFTGDPLATSHRPPLEFYQPQMHAKAFLEVLERFSRMADEHTSIPAYTHEGPGASGAGETASGLSMLLGQASKGVRRMIAEIDIMAIEPAITRTYEHNMLFDPDPTIKGDLRCVARGSTALIVKEQQQLRRTELLRATNNPVDFSLMGPDGRRYLLREVVKAADMEVEKVVPDPIDIAAESQSANVLEKGGGGPAPPGQPGQHPGPAATGPDGAPVAGQDAALFTPTGGNGNAA